MTKKPIDVEKKLDDVPELSEEQAAQVKGGGLWQQALARNDTITSQKSPVTDSTLKKN